MNIVEIFDHILSWSIDLTSRPYEIDDKKHYHLSDISFPFHEKIRTIQSVPELSFLIAPIVEYFFRAIEPALVIPLEDVLAGDTSKIDEIRSLKYALENDPSKAVWYDLAHEFDTKTKEIGYSIDERLFDLPAISDVIIAAKTDFDRLPNDVYQLSKGERSDKRPKVMGDIAVFRNETEILDAYSKLPDEALIGFAGVEHLNRDTDDYFSEWIWKSPCTRRRNSVDSKTSVEQYYDSPDQYSRQLYVVVKDGQNLYLFSVRHNGWESTSVSIGRKNSYAPIQIFSKDPPPVTKDRTAVVLKRDRVWSLREILDDEQKIWLPIFAMEVEKRFFRSNDITALDVILPERLSIVRNDNESSIVLRAVDIVRNSFTIPEPNELFADKYFDLVSHCMSGEDERFRASKTMCEYFGITSKDIADAPIATQTMESVDDANKRMLKRCIEAYQKVISDRLLATDHDYIETIATHKWYHAQVTANFSKIVGRALRNEMSYASTRVHKRPKYNDDGTPKMKQRYTWSSEQLVPDLEETDIGEGKYSHLMYGAAEYRWWSSSTLIGKHPPVVVCINPQNADEVTDLLEIKVEELPFRIRYANEIQLFNCFERYNTHHWPNTIVRLIYGKRDYENTLKKANEVK